MKKLIWKIMIAADGIMAFIFVSQFDVDDMIVQYFGALVCIAVFLLLLVVGWQWVMEDSKDDRITDLWEYRK